MKVIFYRTLSTSWGQHIFEDNVGTTDKRYVSHDDATITISVPTDVFESDDDDDRVDVTYDRSFQVVRDKAIAKLEKMRSEIDEAIVGLKARTYAINRQPK